MKKGWWYAEPWNETLSKCEEDVIAFVIDT